MIKNNFFILAIFIVLLNATMMIGCSQQNQLVGTWVGGGGGINGQITFGWDGTYTESFHGFIYYTNSGTYIVNDRLVTISVPGKGTINYNFEIRGNQLTYTLNGTIYSFVKQ